MKFKRVAFSGLFSVYRDDWLMRLTVVFEEK